ncbi:hypothetical protein RDI58_015655 [Solanum bulbocastanum]|uniref:Uncharacterized protein n=1 Tax=Solanum bulbocastanum TaxID=147425 RepID=A0AAN8TG03_SOLBU
MFEPFFAKLDAGNSMN